MLKQWFSCLHDLVTIILKFELRIRSAERKIEHLEKRIIGMRGSL